MEEFIQKSLPLLNKFDFCFRRTSSNCSEFHSLHSIINQYRTPFWLEHKYWYVTCDYTISASSSQVILYTKSVNIDSGQILIRCQALSTDDIYYFTKYQSNEKDQVNEKEFYLCPIRLSFCIQTIVTLDLNRNDIRSEGFLHLADLIRNNIPLTTLNLEKNQIGHQGMQYLADALCTNTTLTALSIGGNSIGPEGVQHLDGALQNNKTLTKLHIGGNHIGLHGIQCLALTIFDLAGNQIGMMGAKHLTNVLQTNSTLLTLNLWGNRIKDKGAGYLASVLETNKTLTTLDIGSNHIGDDGVEYLAHALKTNRISWLSHYVFIFMHLSIDTQYTEPST
ncbi:unnamed protein product [Rotaria socialis]